MVKDQYMEKIPDVIIRKIHSYFLDLCRKEHFEKFKKVLYVIENIEITYLGIYSNWKIQKIEGKYKFSCFDASTGVYSVRMNYETECSNLPGSLFASV